jgi:hypothetical protein
MTDYRTKEDRVTYFDALYRSSLEHGVLPGLVYLYFPALKHMLSWDEETCLWFAFLNGMTQNPLTSLRLFEQLPAMPAGEPELIKFSAWFDAHWSTLQYDTDRRYQKKDTVTAIASYCRAADDFQRSQVAMLDNHRSWSDLWDFVTTRFKSFGRLAAFSYLEYLQIFGHGLPCTSLMFDDKSGSKSHRNGMLFLMGLDDQVHDKRAGNGFDGNYDNFSKMCEWLEVQAVAKITMFKKDNPGIKHVARETFESNCCQFKNSFFGRRYMGVYADMAYERLVWYHANVGKDRNFKLILQARESLPDWLREEVKSTGLTIKEKAAIFPRTGVPYRAEYFL